MIPTPEELKERTARLSDEALLKVVRLGTAHYRSEALAIAETEITRRGLSRDLPADAEEEEDQETEPVIPPPASLAEPDCSAPPENLPDKEARLGMTRFRMLVFLAQLAILLNYAMPSAIDDSVPIEVENFVLGTVQESDATSLLFTRSVLVYYVTVALDVLSFVTALGLLFFRAWARRLFLFILIARLLFTPATPVFLSTGAASLAGYATSILEGMVLALCYFASMKNRFEQTKTE